MNIIRIINLLRAYFIENKKTLLICSLIVFVATVLDATFSYSIELAAMVACLIPFWISGRFFQSSLKNNNSAHFFNLPVTTGEKLTYSIFITVVFGVIIYLLFNAGAYAGYFGFRPILNPIAENLYEHSGRGLFGGGIEWEWFLFYGTILFAFLFGSIFFRRNAFWKSLVCGVVFFIGLSLYILALFGIAFKNMGGYRVDYEATYQIRNFDFLMDYNIIPVAAILFFLSLTYLRLRETEV